MAAPGNILAGDAALAQRLGQASGAAQLCRDMRPGCGEAAEATEALGSKLPDGHDAVLVACAMMEDEVACALQATGANPHVVWIDRGFHSDPDRLRRELQRRIDWAEGQGANRIMLAFGLCGNGAVGLVTRRAQLAMPRFDDCVNLMLLHGERTCRGLAQAGVMYLTRGWTHDSAATIVGQRAAYVRRYGERKANRLMEAMYGAYRAVSVIDNGCFDVAPVMQVARESAQCLDVPLRCEQGGNRVLEKLVSGQWDHDILVVGPGRPICQEDFEFACGATLEEATHDH